MAEFELTAVKLETDDLGACEAVFGDVFGFRVANRYGGPDAPFEKIVMTVHGEPGMMLKFIRVRDNPRRATGATVQIVLDDAHAGLDAAVAATDQGLDIEIVQRI